MSMHQPASIAGIFRYPVKGLSPEQLAQTDLAPGETVIADRRYAIENGPSGFDPADPQHFTKRKFLMLMTDERLAKLRTRYDDASHVLSIDDDGTITSGNLTTADGRASIEAFFASRFADELRGPPKVLFSDGFSFSDAPDKYVSILNLASVAALADTIGKPVDPLRFRANLHVSGWPAWHEFELVGKKVKIGDAVLEIDRRIVRCAATNVDPTTGARDMEIPKVLLRTEGHADCGVYARVLSGGTIRADDQITVQD